MTLDTSIHKNILVQILIDIYTDTTISPYLGFKGGTAAYLFYGLPRFSVDLDFDLLDQTQEDFVLERITSILKKYGVILEAEKKRHNLLFILSYHNKPKHGQNVKIDINRRSFGSRYDVKAFNGISMLVMIQEDMFANKLVAMHERLGQTNRDIFDVWFFSKSNWSINKELVEKRMEMKYVDFLSNCAKELESMNNHNILHGLGELLTESQKAWAKAKLKMETVIQLKLRLENEMAVATD